jgi:fluoride exporter
MENAIKILAVAGGGALGAVARYLVNLSPLAAVSDKFPFPTFVINVVGSFLIGLAVAAFAGRVDVSESLSAALIVGFIGAFTTFSTFEMEIYSLARDRQLMIIGAYVGLSLILGFLGLLAGMALGRKL